MKEENTLRLIVIFVTKKIQPGEITTAFVNSNEQLTDIFTKSLEVLKLITYVTSLVHMTYMYQLEGEC